MLETDLLEVRRALRGHADSELTSAGLSPVRVPLEALSRMREPALTSAGRCASGVRLSFDTAASTLSIVLELVHTVVERNLHLDAVLSVVATVDGGRAQVLTREPSGRLIIRPDGSADLRRGDLVELRFDLPASSATRLVEVWFPTSAWVTIVSVHSDLPLKAAAPSAAARWIHYGSSISHGADVPDPLGSWPVAAAAMLGLDVTNLGLGGQAQLDSFMARLIRDTTADLITLKVGINLVNADSMRARTFKAAVHGMLDTIRDGHPGTPIVLISPISCTMHEADPGPTRVVDGGGLEATPMRTKTGNGVLALGPIRAILDQVAADRQSDEFLSFMDGRELLGARDEHLLYDRLHPSPEGHALMAERFAAIATERRWLHQEARAVRSAVDPEHRRAVGFEFDLEGRTP